MALGLTAVMELRVRAVLTRWRGVLFRVSSLVENSPVSRCLALRHGDHIIFPHNSILPVEEDYGDACPELCTRNRDGMRICSRVCVIFNFCGPKTDGCSTLCSTLYKSFEHHSGQLPSLKRSSCHRSPWKRVTYHGHTL